MAQRDWNPNERSTRRRPFFEERDERWRDEDEDEGYYGERGRMYGQQSGRPFGQERGQPYGWREREISPFGYEQGRSRDYEGRGYEGRGYEGRGYEGRGYEGRGSEGRGYGSRYEERGYESRDWDPRDYERRRTFGERHHEDQGPIGRMIEKVGRFFGKGPKGYRRSDDRIKEDVCECLWRDPHVDASEIEVEVRSGEVTLKGTVDSRWAKRRAEDLVEDLSGVNDVHNQIRVVSDVSEAMRTTGENGRRTQTTPTTTPRS